VPGELRYLLLHTASPNQVSQIAFDYVLHNGGQGIEHEADAADDQKDRENASTGAKLVNLRIANGAERDDGHVERIEGRHVFNQGVANDAEEDDK